MKRWRKRQNWDWAHYWRSLFENILPSHVCEAAMATCRFQLRGLDSHGNKWGKGLLTYMQTFGQVPLSLNKCVQRRHHWIELDAHESANLILEQFGLSVEDVYNVAGVPAKGETIEVDLFDVVTKSDTDFLITSETSVAVA